MTLIRWMREGGRDRGGEKRGRAVGDAGKSGGRAAGAGRPKRPAAVEDSHTSSRTHGTHAKMSVFLRTDSG